VASKLSLFLAELRRRWKAVPAEAKAEAKSVGAIMVPLVAVALGIEVARVLANSPGLSDFSPPNVFWIFIHGAAALTYSLLGLVLFAHLSSTVSTLSRIGWREYQRWILVRDFRIWLVLLCLVVLWWSGTPWWAYMIGIHYFLNLIKSIAPPNVLILHTFDKANYPFADVLAYSFPALNVLSLFPHRIEGGRNFWRLNTAMAGVGARFSSDDQWQEMVRKYMRWTDLIIFDLSNPREGLLTEIEFLTEEDTVEKTLLFLEGRSPSSPAIISATYDLSEGKANVAFQKIVQHFPAQRVYSYPPNIMDHVGAPVTLGRTFAWKLQVESAIDFPL